MMLDKRLFLDSIAHLFEDQIQEMRKYLKRYPDFKFMIDLTYDAKVFYLKIRFNHVVSAFSEWDYDIKLCICEIEAEKNYVIQRYQDSLLFVRDLIYARCMEYDRKIIQKQKKSNPLLVETANKWKNGISLLGEIYPFMKCDCHEVYRKDSLVFGISVHFPNRRNLHWECVLSYESLQDGLVALEHVRFRKFVYEVTEAAEEFRDIRY